MSFLSKQRREQETDRAKYVRAERFKDTKSANDRGNHVPAWHIFRGIIIIAAVEKQANSQQTIFNSNLVQTQTRPDGGTHLVVVPQFRVFVVLTLPLMIMTMGLTLWLERRWFRRDGR